MFRNISQLKTGLDSSLSLRKFTVSYSHLAKERNVFNIVDAAIFELHISQPSSLLLRCVNINYTLRYTYITILITKFSCRSEKLDIESGRN
mgnify:CR=1 FL=1